MNIFVLDENPIKAAQYLCDKHVCKMIVESCQLLCSVFYFNSNIKPPYKLTHQNHPCAWWARNSRDNFVWLVNHLDELLVQYYLRYGKIHKCTEIYFWIIKHVEFLNFDFRILTPFVQCMPEKYKAQDAVDAYRLYYRYEKLGFAKWKLGNIPDWLNLEWRMN